MEITQKDNNPNKKYIVVAAIENETSGQDFKADKQEATNTICTCKGQASTSKEKVGLLQQWSNAVGMQQMKGHWGPHSKLYQSGASAVEAPPSLHPTSPFPQVQSIRNHLN